MWKPTLGANSLGLGSGTSFRVWAPDANAVEVVLEYVDGTDSSLALTLALTKDADGFFNGIAPAATPGALYRYQVDGRGPFPDPASRFQPRGVHGPSQVVDPEEFLWTDHAWRGIALQDLVLYELHVGTFSPEGTFAGAAGHLRDLKDLGVTAIELMPVADFEGGRNWGYDGVSLFAPARCYGTPEDLQQFVDAAHAFDLAVLLDVVYNHLGPDGAYHSQFSRHYFSDRHRSPWGAGINFDGPCSGPVRDFVVENALHWVHAYHIDGLRLDATHAIVDDGPRNIAAAIASALHESLAATGRIVHVIAEDIRNLNLMLQPEREGGWGLDGVWSDDFHHHVRRALAGDAEACFRDFNGSMEAIAQTARQGWYYCGQYSPHFERRRGTDPAGIPPQRFVFFVQNHDQVGNRALGDRLHHSIPLETYRAASTLLLLLAETPLLFMGQEWAASSPFQYFTDHNPELGKTVIEGRRQEFKQFTAFTSPEDRDRIPDPQAVETFLNSQLQWEERQAEPHAAMLRFYRKLLQLRQRVKGPATIQALGEDAVAVRRDGQANSWLAIVRLRGRGVVHLGEAGIAQAADDGWRLLMTTEDPCFTPRGRPPVVHARPFEIDFQDPGAVLMETPTR